MSDRPIIIAVTNRKGGVGKSTMTTHIAAGLSLLGHQIGIVDTDSQGHAGYLMGMPEENGLYELLINHKSIDEVARLVDPSRYSPPGTFNTGNLWLVPSSDKTYKIPKEMDESDVFAFLDMVENYAKFAHLQAIFIDTNPTLSPFDAFVWMAADAYIYVTECEQLSFDGIQTAIQQVQRVGVSRERHLGRQSHVLGIIPNKFRANTAVHRLNIESLSTAYPGLVWPPVTLRTAWVEAANFHELIYHYYPDHQEHRDAMQLVARTAEALKWLQTV